MKLLELALAILTFTLTFATFASSTPIKKDPIGTTANVFSPPQITPSSSTQLSPPESSTTGFISTTSSFTLPIYIARELNGGPPPPGKFADSRNLRDVKSVGKDFATPSPVLHHPKMMISPQVTWPPSFTIPPSILPLPQNTSTSTTTYDTRECSGIFIARGGQDVPPPPCHTGPPIDLRDVEGVNKALATPQLTPSSYDVIEISIAEQATHDRSPELARDSNRADHDLVARDPPNCGTIYIARGLNGRVVTKNATACPTSTTKPAVRSINTTPEHFSAPSLEPQPDPSEQVPNSDRNHRRAEASPAPYPDLSEELPGLYRGYKHAILSLAPQLDLDPASPEQTGSDGTIFIARNNIEARVVLPTTSNPPEGQGTGCVIYIARYLESLKRGLPLPPPTGCPAPTPTPILQIKDVNYATETTPPFPGITGYPIGRSCASTDCDVDPNGIDGDGGIFISRERKGVRQFQVVPPPSGPTQQNGPDHKGDGGGIHIAKDLSKIADGNSASAMGSSHHSQLRKACTGTDCDVDPIWASVPPGAIGRNIQQSQPIFTTLTLTAPTAINVPAQTGHETGGVVVITQKSSSHTHTVQTTHNHTLNPHPTLTLTDPTTITVLATGGIVIITALSSTHTPKSRTTHSSTTETFTTTTILEPFSPSPNITTILPIQFTSVPRLHPKNDDARTTIEHTLTKMTSSGGERFTAPVTSWSTFSTLPTLRHKRGKNTKPHSLSKTISTGSSNSLPFTSPISSWSTFSTLPTLSPKVAIHPPPPSDPKHINTTSKPAPSPASSCTITLIRPTPLTLGTVFTSHKSTRTVTIYNDCGGCALVTSNPWSLERTWDKTRTMHGVKSVTTELCAPSYVMPRQTSLVSAVEDVHHIHGPPPTVIPELTCPTTLLTRTHRSVTNMHTI